jgi:hypothetical protein
MIKSYELSIVITMTKNDYKSFDMNIDKSTPPSIYIPTYLPTHQPTYHFLPILQLAYYLLHSLVVI